MTILHGVHISMDPYNNAAFTNMDAVAGEKGLEPGTNLDHRPRQLQKKRSFTSTPSGQISQQFDSSEASYPTGPRGSIARADGTKVRQGSIRNAVRRMFGRRSREGEARQTPPVLYSPLQYSEDSSYGLMQTDQGQASSLPQDDIVQRTLSAPALPQPDLQRPRSPYGFPHSARLKPLDLGNPFTAPKASASRRKSMPSLLINEADAVALRAEIEAADVVVAIDADTLRAVEQSIGATRHEKRRSRSANDLRRESNEAEVSPRRQKEEMRKWRESLGGGVLRASGFTTRSPPRPTISEEHEASELPMADNESPYAVPRSRLATPAYQRDLSEREVGSGSTFGNDMSRDLEDRVTRLEAGLQSFRGQLAQLSAYRNRRTILIGSPTSGDTGKSTLHRSASMLASDLRDDLRPSDYQYEYTNTRSPASPSRPPRTPTHADPTAVTPNFSIHDRNTQDPFTSPPRQPPSTPPERGDARADLTTNPPIPAHYTFRSLYEMLTDERSARRRLETQLNALRAEIATLHSQLAFQSNNTHQSQRSSYYYAPVSGPTHPAPGSTRLHALLQETDMSPPSTAHSSQQQQQQQRDSGRFSFPGREDLMSRWSESEMGGAPGERDSVQSLYEVFRTPVEEQGRWNWGRVVPKSARGVEAEMF